LESHIYRDQIIQNEEWKQDAMDTINELRETVTTRSQIDEITSDLSTIRDVQSTDDSCSICNESEVMDVSQLQIETLRQQLRDKDDQIRRLSESVQSVELVKRQNMELTSKINQIQNGLSIKENEVNQLRDTSSRLTTERDSLIVQLHDQQHTMDGVPYNEDILRVRSTSSSSTSLSRKNSTYSTHSVTTKSRRGSTCSVLSNMSGAGAVFIFRDRSGSIERIQHSLSSTYNENYVSECIEGDEGSPQILSETGYSEEISDLSDCEMNTAMDNEMNYTLRIDDEHQARPSVECPDVMEQEEKVLISVDWNDRVKSPSDIDWTTDSDQGCHEPKTTLVADGDETETTEMQGVVTTIGIDELDDEEAAIEASKSDCFLQTSALTKILSAFIPKSIGTSE